MKKKLITVVKVFKPLYNIYYYIASFIIKIIKTFIKTDNNLILFVSFGGKKYDDSPQVLYEKMINDKRFDNFEFVWAFNEPDKVEIQRGKKIKIDTVKYFITALKARCWITNSSIQRGLNFKGKNTFYINTWHGTPLKKMGSDIESDNKSFKPKAKWEEDIMIAQGKYDVDVFSRVFGIDRNKFIITGLPRNDRLANVKERDIETILRKMNISKNKKIVLYAPTFREYERDEQMNCVMNIPIDFKNWKQELGDDYVILFRAHYEVAKTMKVFDNNFVIDVCDYPNLNDLMIISDILISDYSSIFFDYSILNKPMIAFTYDYDKYNSNRGMYFDIRNELFNCTNEKELLKLITYILKDKDLAIRKTNEFKHKYIEAYGQACDICVDKIYENII